MTMKPNDESLDKVIVNYFIASYFSRNIQKICSSYLVEYNRNKRVSSILFLCCWSIILSITLSSPILNFPNEKPSCTFLERKFNGLTELLQESFTWFWPSKLLFSSFSPLLLALEVTLYGKCEERQHQSGQWEGDDQRKREVGEKLPRKGKYDIH